MTPKIVDEFGSNFESTDYRYRTNQLHFEPPFHRDGSKCAVFVMTMYA